MNRRLYRASTKGQSIPLIAVMLAVLFGLAALSLDVGITYAEQRDVVRATNAAALDGMNSVIDNGGYEGLRTIVYNSLRSNGIQVQPGGNQIEPGDKQWDVIFLDAAGHGFETCPSLNECGPDDYNGIVGRITYLRVSVDGKVDTYFARLFGRPDLPVGAVAHATRGACVNGVYPIAVDSAILDRTNMRFDPPDAIYNDEIWGERTQKRIYLHEIQSPGQFGFMRWTDGTDEPGTDNTNWLAAALTGAGNLNEGFEEAPWPVDNNGNSTVPLAITDGYPQVPTQLSVGDWVYGNDGNNINANAVEERLDLLITNRTIMTLPIYDYVAGNGNNAAYHVIDLGRFYIRGYGHEPPRGTYIDLVYLSRGAECASLASGGTTPLMSIEGNVSLYPHYKLTEETGDLPVQYIIVFDVSGSMAWNFAGVGTENGNLVQCQGAVVPGGPPAPSDGQCPASSPHPNVSERRITIAREVLRSFVQSLSDRPNDLVRLVTFSGTYGSYYDPAIQADPPSNEDALDVFSHVYPANWVPASNTAALLSAVDQATATASGETASAIGLARALQIYSDSPTHDPVSGKIYKRAVIFLTDGVANVTRNGLLNTSATCGAEDADCQDGQWPDGTLKPVSAMTAEALSLQALITPEEAGRGGVYVIALGDTNLAALQRVSSSGQPFSALDADTLEQLLDAIRDDIVFGTCSDGSAVLGELTQIQANGLPDYSNPLIAGRLVSPEVGYVTLTASGGQEYSGKILWYADSGRMYYRINDIPPGQYTMTYWMAYKGLDGVTRIYDHAVAGDGSILTQSQIVPMQPGADTLGGMQFPLTLDMDPALNVCTES